MLLWLFCFNIFRGPLKTFIFFFFLFFFSDQGDQEKSIGMPVTPIFDRQSGAVANSQQGFIKFIVRPLFEAWMQYLDNEHIKKECLDQLVSNQLYWEQWEGEENDVLEADHETLRIDIKPRGESNSVSSGYNSQEKLDEAEKFVLETIRPDSQLVTEGIQSHMPHDGNLQSKPETNSTLVKPKVEDMETSG